MEHDPRPPPVSSPPLLLPSASQVAIDKFANYFDVELRSLPVRWPCPALQPAAAAAACDERTIGVVAILGSTYTGHFEDVRGLNAALGELELPHG